MSRRLLIRWLEADRQQSLTLCQACLAPHLPKLSSSSEQASRCRSSDRCLPEDPCKAAAPAFSDHLRFSPSCLSRCHTCKGLDIVGLMSIRLKTPWGIQVYCLFLSLARALKAHKLTMRQTASEHQIHGIDRAAASLPAYLFTYQESKKVAMKKVDSTRDCSVLVTLPHNTLKCIKQIFNSFEVQ